MNFDAPDVYHLYYGDETGAPGSVLTFFEFPGAARGRAGAGMVHRIIWQVGSPDALAFWVERLTEEGVETERANGALRFADPEGLGLELAAADAAGPALAAQAQDIPAEHALQGFAGLRAFARAPQASAALLGEGLGFAPGDDGAWAAPGARRATGYAYDPPPEAPGIQGAGTVHHVAWCAADDAELDAYRGRLTELGAHPTPIVDRDYFHSIYFREPSGVLFELATAAPGFAVDEPAEDLGEMLKLPARYEPMREQLERQLAPLPHPHASGARS